MTQTLASQTDAVISPSRLREESRQKARTPKRTWHRHPLVRLISPVILLVLWQLFASLGWLSARILPSPAQVFQSGLELLNTGELQANLTISLQRVVIGAALGLLAGLIAGLLVGFWWGVEVAIDPPLQMLRTVPFLGLIPLFVLWFGIGELPKVLMVAQATFFPFYIAVFAGVRQTESKLLELSKTLKLNRWQVAWHVILPSTIPQALTGLRLALGVAWLALVVAEQINADSGIGYLVMNARTYMRIDIVVLGLVIYAILGLLTDALVRLVERITLRWKAPR